MLHAISVKSVYYWSDGTSDAERLLNPLYTSPIRESGNARGWDHRLAYMPTANWFSIQVAPSFIASVAIRKPPYPYKDPLPNSYMRIAISDAHPDNDGQE